MINCCPYSPEVLQNVTYLLLEFKKEERGKKKENRTAISEAKELGVQTGKKNHGEAAVNTAKDKFRN